MWRQRNVALTVSREGNEVEVLVKILRVFQELLQGAEVVRIPLFSEIEGLRGLWDRKDRADLKMKKEFTLAKNT